MVCTAALPRTISRKMPAPPTLSARTTTAKSSNRTPSDSSTTPSEGSVSRPVNGAARKAPSEPAITNSPKTVLLARWSNRKRRRGREKRSIQRITFISPLMKRVRPPPVPSSTLRQRSGNQILSRPTTN